jgi:hypothetical protein
MAQEPLPEVLKAIKALQVSSMIGAISSGTIALLGFISFVEHRKEFNFRQPVKRWRFFLLVAATISFITLSIDAALVWRHWKSPDEDIGCRVLTTLMPLGYILEKQFLSLFLYDRAKIVHSAISLGGKRDWYLKMLRWLLFIVLVVGMPLCFYWSPFAAFGGEIRPEGECIFYTIFPEVPVAFAVADTFLAAGMLLIFIAPLYAHKTEIKSMGGSHSAESFQRMIRNNLILSGCAILCGWIGLIGLSTFNWLYDGTRETEHLPTWGLFVITFDNFLSVIL